MIKRLVFFARGPMLGIAEKKIIAEKKPVLWITSQADCNVCNVQPLLKEGTT